MKTTLIFLTALVLSAAPIQAQSILVANNFSFSETITANGSSSVLYNNANQWILGISRPGDQFLAKTENEKIVFFGSVPLSNIRGICPISGSKLSFKLTIQFTDQGYEYKLNELIHTYSSICDGGFAYSTSEVLKDSNLKDKRKDKVYKEVEDKLEAMISEMKAAI